MLLLLSNPALADTPADALPDWAPSVEAVAALVHARTTQGGYEHGTFDDDTIPTREQTIRMIAIACADIVARVGIPIPDLDVPRATYLAALQAASLIEASYFPAELDTDRSAYRQMQAMYLSGIEMLAGKLRTGPLRLV